MKTEVIDDMKHNVIRLRNENSRLKSELDEAKEALRTCMSAMCGHVNPKNSAWTFARSVLANDARDRRFTDDQVEAWMLRYDIRGSLREGRCALEDAATLHLTDGAF